MTNASTHLCEQKNTLRENTLRKSILRKNILRENILHGHQHSGQSLVGLFDNYAENSECLNSSRLMQGESLSIDRERGSMLIIALSVLTLLAILGVTFAGLMRLERQAAENFAWTARAKAVANSAESAAVNMLRGGLYWTGYTDPRKNDTYLYMDSKKESLLGRVSLEDIDRRKSSFYGLINQVKGSAENGYFKTKIIDTNSQININGPQNNIAEILDNLGKALSADVRYGKNPLWSGANESGKLIRGEQILRYRETLPGKVFETKRQLIPIIGKENYELIADFITTKSYVNPYTQRASDGFQHYKTRGDSSSSSSGSGSLTGNNDPVSAGAVTGAPRLTPQPRSPININSAPRPVLIAVLAGLSGRRAFPFVTDLVTQNVDAQSTAPAIGPSNEKEETSLRQDPVWVYTQPLTVAQATKIAQEIVVQRRRQPFKSWQGELNDGGFEEFVNQLEDNIFPSPNTVRVVDPANSGNNNRYQSTLLGRGSEAGQMFSKGHTASRSIRRNAGLGHSPQHAWYYDTWRSILIANFNPNSRLNKYNPCQPVYLPVDKTGLIKVAGTGRITASNARSLPAHTTEFCFDAMGIFEINSMAEIKADIDKGSPIAVANQRSIVKIWEVLHHTTQQQFSRPFDARSVTSKKDRERINTAPDAIEALHPDHFWGASNDGYVEMLGGTDAQAEESPSHKSPLENRAEVQYAHSLRYRTPESLSKVSNNVRRGVAVNESQEELLKIFEAEVTQGNKNLRKVYNDSTWNNSTAYAGGSKILDPRIEKASLSSSVLHDGFHNSMFRVAPTGGPVLHVPALKFRPAYSNIGDVGSYPTNDTGNLSYYQGAVSFWIKFEIDPNDPIFSGYLLSTQVVRKVDAALGANSSEGTQMMIFKNTEGKLRIVRLYYRKAFDSTGSSLVPQITDPGEMNDNIILDPKKAFARVDSFVTIPEEWAAHEWHNIRIGYNDTTASPEEAIKVWLDFEEADSFNDQKPDEPFSDPSEMVLSLNVVEPRDGVQIGGFVRYQKSHRYGVIKHGTNYSESDGTATNQASKRTQANGTMDEIVFYNKANAIPLNNRVGYFTDKSSGSKYANVFRVPLPDGVNRVRLRSLCWSEYQPKIYAGKPVRVTPLQCTVNNLDNRATEIRVRTPNGDPSQNTQINGHWLYSQDTQKTGRVAELPYKFLFQAATGQGAGNYGSRKVASPVLDDVTLTYYLPSAQILLTETED